MGLILISKVLSRRSAIAQLLNTEIAGRTYPRNAKPLRVDRSNNALGHPVYGVVAQIRMEGRLRTAAATDPEWTSGLPATDRAA